LLEETTKQQIRDAYAKLIEGKSLSPRWGQREMIAEIAKALGRIDDDDETGAAVCVIEAGTGTGKTIAYAVAAIPLAQALGKKLVVSTATIALQEQFVNKDLPDIRRHSGLQFDYVLAKGRRRYVCLSKLDKLMAVGGQDQSVMPLYPDELAPPLPGEAIPVYSGMLDALGRGEWDGDRDNWPQEINEEVWFAATSDHSQCSGRRCPNVGQCSFFRARDALQNTDVIVSNHDLVLSDLALGGGAILSPPEETIYIFDEGHHLPEKALNHFSGFCRLGSSQQWLDDSRKQLAQAASALVAMDEVQALLQKIPAAMDEISAGLTHAEQVLAQLIDPVELQAQRDASTWRLPHGLVPEELQIPARTLSARLEALHRYLQQLEDGMEDALEGEVAGVDRDEAEAWYSVFGAMLNRAEGNLQLWREYAVSGEGEDPPKARWVNLVDSGGQLNYELRCSPILARDILQEVLWNRAAGVVATSATMTALNSFDRFMLHSGAPTDSVFKVVASPFDHSRAVLSVPAMDCDPGDAPAHTAALIELLPQLLEPRAGSLVLFSSRRQMHDVYEGLPAPWPGRVLMQGDHSKQETLRRHREAVDAGNGSVIFGLASFAEGVDLPGDYCSHVIIAKIPFAVPDSPMEAALAEWVENQGRNAFMEISVPDAALRLVQASGRLLRTEQDSGRVTLLDRRVMTRRYGRAILDSLPPFRRELA
jgi:ATP-dependent DNA helicase DinG